MVYIEKPADNLITVNGKEVYKSSNDSWVARQELTTMESDALLNYLQGNTSTITEKGNNSDYYINPEFEKIVGQIQAEREFQDAKFGKQNHAPMVWVPILVEEVGEVAKAALETHFKYDGADTDYSNYRAELIQVAAVAVAMVQSIDRQQNDTSN